MLNDANIRMELNLIKSILSRPHSEPTILVLKIFLYSNGYEEYYPLKFISF